MDQSDFHRMIQDISDIHDNLGYARRKANETRLLLIDAQHALDNGRLAIVQEFLERAVEKLTSITKEGG